MGSEEREREGKDGKVDGVCGSWWWLGRGDEGSQSTKKKKKKMSKLSSTIVAVLFTCQENVKQPLNTKPIS